MPSRPNIAATIFRETAACPERTALIEGRRSLTYAELAETVGRLARTLDAAGVRPLDRVAFLCPDGIDYVLLSLAILALDAALVPISPTLMSDERETLAERMDVHHLLSDASVAPDAAGAPLAALPGVAHTFHLLHRAPREAPAAAYAAIRPAFIRFSSGTTGASKGVVLAHETILDRTDAANEGLNVTSADVIGWVLSMSFHFVVTILLFLRKGATLVICGEPMPGGLVDALRQHPITLLYASPLHYQMLTMAEALTPGHLARVRLAVSTAIKLPATVAREFHARFGIRLTEAYGIIEVGLPFIHTPEAGPHDGWLGKPLPAYTVRLDENGEVLIRGKGMFEAYFSPWQPRAVCQPDGWFHTGDIGERGADGSLRLVGRCKALINFSGMKLFPQEIEEVLNQHPAVAESQVYGEPHPHYGQIPCARLVLRPGAAFDEADLLAFCRARLATCKLPKHFAVVPALEKTASGKVRRA